MTTINLAESQNLPFSLPALRSPQGEGWVSDFDIRISDFNHSGCFMQNKPNLLDAQMNLSSFITKYYENKRLRRRGENKPNSNPIQSQSKPIQTQTNPIHEKPE